MKKRNFGLIVLLMLGMALILASCTGHVDAPTALGSSSSAVGGAQASSEAAAGDEPSEAKTVEESSQNGIARDVSGYEKSTFVDPGDTSVSLAIVASSITPSSATLQVVNNTQEVGGYGYEFVLEEKIDGEWYVMPNDIAWSEIWMELKAGETVELGLTFEPAQSAGEYRVHKGVSIADAHKRYAVEFEITEDMVEKARSEAQSIKEPTITEIEESSVIYQYDVETQTETVVPAESYEDASRTEEGAAAVLNEEGEASVEASSGH